MELLGTFGAIYAVGFLAALLIVNVRAVRANRKLRKREGGML